MKKSIKKNIGKKNPLIGSWITIPDINIIEIFTKFSFDWLCIDMEHSAISIDKIPVLTSLIEAKNISPLVRVGEHNPNLIKRIMDCGAHGIIAADVRTVEEAENIINSVKYPPIGQRGVGLYKAQHYGQGFSDYISWLKSESIVIVQIENQEAVKNLDSILSLKNLDGIMIGPYDLSSSIGHPGNFKNKEYQILLDAIIKKTKKYNKLLGIHSVTSNPTDYNNFRKNGYNFIACSLDTIFLMDNIKKYFNKINKKI